jgi:AraC family transcriptional regulator
MPRASTLADYQQRILRAQQLLEQHLDEPIDPAALAKCASFSLHHFHRIFRAQLGESVMQHVRRLRLERAARRLRASDTDILAVALEAGYESHEAFTRAFAERFGVPPSVFRGQPSARIAAWEPMRNTRPPVAVRVEDMPGIHVAFMRNRGSYAVVHLVWGQLRAWISRTGATGALYGVCPDDPEMTTKRGDRRGRHEEAAPRS